MPTKDGAYVTAHLNPRDMDDFKRVKAYMRAKNEASGWPAERADPTNSNVVRFALLIARGTIEAWEKEVAP